MLKFFLGKKNKGRHDGLDQNLTLRFYLPNASSPNTDEKRYLTANCGNDNALLVSREEIKAKKVHKTIIKISIFNIKCTG